MRGGVLLGLLETLLLGVARLLLALVLQIVGRGLICPGAKQTEGTRD
jgi:hypothetical protein